MILNKFHEDDYDGVVLKIPLWFIEMNNLDQQFNLFKESLKTADKSMYLADHQKNLYELDNWQLKKSFIKEKKDKLENDKRAREKEYQDIINGNKFILDWKRINLTIGDTVSFSEDAESLDAMKVCTKSGVKAEYKRLFKEKVKSIQDLIDFSYHNNIPIYGSVLKDIPEPECMLESAQLYLIKYNFGMVGLGLDQLTVRVVNKPTPDGGYRYNSMSLHFDGNDYYYLDLNHKRIDLIGFTKKGMELIRNKQ